LSNDGKSSNLGGLAAPRLRLSKGNRKIDGSIGVWSLPAPKTCPGAGACYWYCNGFKVQKGLNGVVLISRQNNFIASLRSDFVERMVALIQSLKVTAVRVHEAGDFYNKDYIRKWEEIARKLPNVRFFAYTKSLRFMPELLRLRALPNFKLIFSYGGKLDKLINPAKDDYSRVIKTVDEVRKGEFLCPAVVLSGKANGKFCGYTCDLCLGKNDGKGKPIQVRLDLLLERRGWNGGYSQLIHSEAR
jgi:hypothetical protein